MVAAPSTRITPSGTGIPSKEPGRTPMRRGSHAPPPCAGPTVWRPLEDLVVPRAEPGLEPRSVWSQILDLGFWPHKERPWGPLPQAGENFRVRKDPP